ncbi:MAG: glycosyltransferase [Kineosporiaceae bacterium]
MKVLVVTVVHDPSDARIRFRQIPALLRAGAEVTYAAPFTAYGRTAPEGVRALDVPRARGRRRGRAVRAARALVRAEGPRHDVVLVHDPELLLALAPLTRGRARRRDGGVPAGRPVLVWDVHEDTAAALGMRGWLPAPLRPLAARAVVLAERWAERHVQLLLAEYSYQERFSRTIPVVPNSTLVPQAQPSPPGTDRVVYLGRITGARGGEDLAELGRALAGSGIRVELIGNADAEVAGAIAAAHEAGWVHHHGFVPNDEALALLDGACAGISLLHDEPNYAWSRVTKLMEYMAYGLPVVSTANPASVELLQKYDAGVVVPFGTPAEVGAAAAEQVRRLAADDELRQRLAANGRRAAVEDLDWTRDGEAFAATLQGWVDGAV